jgi:cation diffusion facilitator family transporter
MVTQSAAHESGHEHSHLLLAGDTTSEGVRALRIGVAGLLATTALQVVLLALSGSVSLLGDTVHNGVDVAGTAVVWAAFVAARRAKSERFGYGFHRAEDLAGLAVVVLIAASAALVLYESATAFGGAGDVERPALVLLAGLIGFAGNEAVAQFKIRTGRSIGSVALVADGEHSRADGLTSLGVVAAAVGLFAGIDWLDAAIGIGIGLVIAWTAWGAGRDVLYRLLDASDPLLRETLLQAAATVPDVDHVSELRIPQLGRTVHAVANVCVRADHPLSRAHEAAEALRLAWLHVLPPGSIVDIHVDPYTPGRPVPHEA